ncbi:MAG: hypothetical protein E7645_02580 [Ruminococcaceae bacterium]|nr:hypothetical protein [Oscillospiraceae bacterium]
MTPAYKAPERKKFDYRLSVPRILFVGVMLFVLVAGCLYLYHNAFSEYGQYLIDEEKKTSAWLVEQLSYLLPIITVAAFQYCVYAKYDHKDGLLQRERAYELLILAGLVYLVFLPLLWRYSDRQLILSLMAGLQVDKTEGKTYETLFLKVLPWLIRFSVSIMLLFVYHMARAKAEKIETKTAEAEKATLEATKTVARAETETEDASGEVEVSAGDVCEENQVAPTLLAEEKAEEASQDHPTKEAGHDPNPTSV